MKPGALIVLAVVCVVFPSAALAQTAGGGGLAAEGYHFGFGAKDQGLNEKDAGGMVLTYSRPNVGDVTARVDCAFVVGNRAVMSGPIIRGTGEFANEAADGAHFSYFVEDNGEPGAGRDKIMAQFIGGDPVPFERCIPLLVPVQLVAAAPIVKGDIKVTP